MKLTTNQRVRRINAHTATGGYAYLRASGLGAIRITRARSQAGYLQLRSLATGVWHIATAADTIELSAAGEAPHTTYPGGRDNE